MIFNSCKCGFQCIFLLLPPFKMKNLKFAIICITQWNLVLIKFHFSMRLVHQLFSIFNSSVHVQADEETWKENEDAHLIKLLRLYVNSTFFSSSFFCVAEEITIQSIFMWATRTTLYGWSYGDERIFGPIYRHRRHHLIISFFVGKLCLAATELGQIQTQYLMFIIISFGIIVVRICWLKWT